MYSHHTSYCFYMCNYSCCLILTLDVSNNSGSSSDSGVIIGGAVGGVILLLMIIVVLCIVILCMRRSHRKESSGLHAVDNTAELNTNVTLDYDPPYDVITTSNPKEDEYGVVNQPRN